jgi:hypothetical protein
MKAECSRQKLEVRSRRGESAGRTAAMSAGLTAARSMQSPQQKNPSVFDHDSPLRLVFDTAAVRSSTTDGCHTSMQIKPAMKENQ